jgi:hypothetical protein
MSTRTHIIGLILCGALIASFQYVALVWSFADFHPGYIPDLPEYLHRRARIGTVMFLPFQIPLSALRLATGEHSSSFGLIQWLVIPLCYGAIIYFGYVFVRQRLFHANRNV